MATSPRTAARPTTPQAIPAATPLLTRPLSRNPLSNAPRKGRTGMIQRRSFMLVFLALEVRRLVELRRLAQAVEGDQDAQPHRRLARGHGDGEDREDLSGQIRELIRERDQVQVHRVEHQLDRHQHGDHVLARGDPEDADGEEQAREHQIVRSRHLEHESPSRRKQRKIYCRRPSTTAPIIAISRKIEAISKGRRFWVYRFQATAWELPRLSPWTVTNTSGLVNAGPNRYPAKKYPKITRTTTARRAAQRLWPPKRWISGSRCRFTSMMTNRNSTMMPPP